MAKANFQLTFFVKLAPYIILALFIYAPSCMFYTGFLGTSIVFPTYLLATTIFAVIALALLWFFLHLSSQKIIITILFIILVIHTEVALLYSFTPFLDHLFFFKSVEKLCDSEYSYRAWLNNSGSTSGVSQINEGCTKLHEMIGR